MNLIPSHIINNPRHKPSAFARLLELNTNLCAYATALEDTLETHYAKGGEPDWVGNDPRLETQWASALAAARLNMPAAVALEYVHSRDHRLDLIRDLGREDPQRAVCHAVTLAVAGLTTGTHDAIEKSITALHNAVAFQGEPGFGAEPPGAHRQQWVLLGVAYRLVTSAVARSSR